MYEISVENTEAKNKITLPALLSISVTKLFMKLIDITDFCLSTNGLKPVIEHVYVFKKDGKLFTAATDAFKLIEVFYDTDNKDYMYDFPDGFYSIDKWKKIAKEWNTKTPKLLKIDNLVKENTAIVEISGDFPDYDRLFTGDRIPVTNQSFSTKDFSLFIKKIGDTFSFSDLRSLGENKPIVYEKDNIRMLIMPANL